jgi:serine/threonine-protein kinase RsbW
MDKSSRRSSKSTGVSKPIRKNDRIEIPSSLDHLPRVDQFIEEKLKRLGMDKSQIYDIAISVSEVVTNAVVHGNKNDLNRRVKIDLKADASRVEVTVEDEGSGFDRECICSPIEKENLLKKAGRGLLIVESLMDKVSICRKPKGGTQVKIVKNIR